MIPIQDQNPTSIRPYVNWGFIIANIAVFVYTLANGTLSETFTSCAASPTNTICQYGLKPSNIISGTEYVTFLTSMFLHGGILHIGGNMLYLWIFGDNIEDATGHLGYMIFYMAAGAAASLAHIASDPSSMVPAVGASGAISGVLGAYIVRFPHARVRAIVFIGRFGQLIRLPAYILIGFWFVYQLLLSLIDIEGGVAYFAHIGGFIAGLVFALAVLRKKPEQPGGTSYPQFG